MLNVDDLQAVIREIFDQRIQTEITKMLVINIVNDAIVQKSDQVSGLKSKNAGGRKQSPGAFGKISQILDVGHDIIRRDDGRGPALFSDLFGQGAGKKRV